MHMNRNWTKRTIFLMLILTVMVFGTAVPSTGDNLMISLATSD